LLVKSAKEHVRKKSSSYTYCRQLNFESRAIKIFSSTSASQNSAIHVVLEKSANLFHEINATRHSQISLDAINVVDVVLMMENTLVVAVRMDDDAVTNPTEKVYIVNIKSGKFGIGMFLLSNTKYIYTVYPRRNWGPTPSPASVPLHRNQKRGDAHSPADEGGGGVPIPTTREKAMHSVLCAKP
jgi:hypothetical protein